MSIRRVFLFLLVAVALLIATSISTKSNNSNGDSNPGLIVGRNVNMVAGQSEIDGDPFLQRQNEPSIAVSTRNPMHLLAASNDYRLVDFTESEGPIPGLPEQAAAGDAWLGIYKSYNGGQSWKSSLLPGHPFDNTVEGQNSLLYGLGASTDPTVRSGMGLFFLSGIAFDRVEHGRSVIFVSRFVDNNTAAIGDPDPIKYIDTKLLDDGTSGQFADKPWLAIDIPRYGTDPVPIETPGLPEQTGTLIQDIPRFNVYVVYSIFLGSEQGHPHSKIMFVKSNDCGESFQQPVKLSESVHVCQGTNVVVSPKDGTIYVAWRQYAREDIGVPHAIVMCKSDDMGETFSKATVVAEIDPFDQFTDVETFRTSAFPALAADDNGLVYVAWSQRGEGPLGEARIVIKTSMDGINWDGPFTAIDNSHERGHQIMPSLIFNGSLVATWLDTRKSLGNIGEQENYIYDDEISGISHTIDTWIAQAYPSDPDPPIPANPVFFDSTQVSRYLYEPKLDSFGHLAEPLVIYQAQFSHPNFPIFVGGTRPFIGDYIDITPAPMFLTDYDEQNGTWSWRFNTGEDEFDPTLSYVAFGCNRDVVPPRPGGDWRFYWPPGSEPCDVWTTGMRNQNVYSAPITHGIFVGAPVNTKPLVLYRRSFLVFVKNLTDSEKLIKLAISAPNDMNASFWEFGSPEGPEGECPLPFSSCTDRIVELPVLAHSSITLTVFVQPYDNALQTFRVNVEEIDPVSGNPTGLRSSVILNPDPVNTQMIPVQEEYHTITMVSEDPFPVDLSDATMLSDPIVYSSYLEELLNYSNPDIVAPGLRHPGLRHDTVINPGLRHSALEDPIPTGQVTDLQWKVTNDTNMTSAYSFDAIGETPSVPHQLLIYRVSGTPISDPNCVLSEEEHHELLLTIESPGLRHPGLRHPGLRHPGLRHNTFFLAPGEEAIITLRLIDKNNPHPFDPEFVAKTVAGAAIPQASTDGEIQAAAFMWISTTTLPDGLAPGPYPTTPLVAQPEEGSYSWDVVPGYEDLLLPPGLEVTAGGEISGTIEYDPPYDYDDVNDIYEKTYNFAVQATDTDNDTGQTVYRSLSIRVLLKSYIISASAGAGGSIDHEGDVKVFHGFDQPFNITVTDPCFYINSIETDDELLDLASQELDSYTYTFNDVIADNRIHATFERKTFTITPDVIDDAGGEIDPPDPTPVACDSTPMFTITPYSCFHLVSVKVDGYQVVVIPEDESYTYTFPPVTQNYAIVAKFEINTYTITAKAGELDEAGNPFYYANGEGLGGSISPAGDKTVTCGESQTFTISTNEGYQLVDVLVDGDPVEDITKGPLTAYPFNNVQKDYLIEAIFKKLEAWVKRYNNDSVNGDDEANDIAVDLSGNSYVTGYSLGSPTGPDFYTISYDSDGNEGLSARYDGPAHDGDYANAIAVDGGGNVYATGYSYRGMAGKKHKDYCIVKYNSSRELVWDSRYDARRNGNDEATDIAVDDDGNVYVTGSSEESLSTKSDVLHYDFYTIKYEPGRREGMVWGWGARYNNDLVDGADKATGIAVDAAGNVYVTGFSYNGKDNDIVTIKYDPDGNAVWSDEETGNVRRYDGGLNDEAADIAVDAAGNVYVTGRSQRNGNGFDYVTIKYDTNGNQEWVKWYSPLVIGDDAATAIAFHEEGEDVFVYVTGYSSNGTDNDYVTIKYDPDGNFAWDGDIRRLDGENGVDEAIDIAMDSAGNVYVTGKSQGWNQDLNESTGFDYFTIRYDISGNMIWRARYNNSPVNLDDEATAIAVDKAGNIFVTGRSVRILTDFDFATVKYEQHIE